VFVVCVGEKVRVAILAGGWGTRFAEETDVRPKPMIEIGDKPILWHIMMQYYASGFKDFAIALGYKGDVIKRWMIEFAQFQGDLRISTASGEVRRFYPETPEWNIDLVETGLYTNTGGRVKALADNIGRERFFLSWGDGVSDIDLNALLAFHEAHGKLATMTVVHPPARFGHVELHDNHITEFNEKPQAAEGWINGGYFVLEPGIFDYIEGPDTAFERAPLEHLARDGQLMAFKHDGFWQCMDTLRDKRLLNKIWDTGEAPWATWEAAESASLSRVTAAT